MSAETLALLAGAVLSLGFSYIPGLSTWYANLGTDPNDGGTAKRLVMLGLLLVVAAAVYGLACAGWGADFGLAITCDKQGLVELLRAFVLAVIANQGMYGLTPTRK